MREGLARDPRPVTPVASVDLERYAGDWFEIARLPNWFERRCVADVTASYRLRPDGRLDVVNRCRSRKGSVTARGVARVVDDRTRARLKVRFAPALLSFLPFVWGDYWILALGDAYEWAVVGTPDRRCLWVLSRTPRLADASVARALDRAQASDFDLERLVLVPHAV